MEPTRPRRQSRIGLAATVVSALILLAIPVLPAAAGAPAVTAVCDGDGVSGKRVQVLYAREASRTDQLDARLAEFRRIAAEASDWINQTANQSGRTRHVRYVHDAACQPVVERVVLPDGTSSNPVRLWQELRAQGHSRADRSYVAFVDGPSAGGLGGIADAPRLDDSPGPANANNGGNALAAVWSWGTPTFLHELLHTLGAVQESAPNSGNNNHCFDSYDIMCYSSGGQFNACPPAPGLHELDCGRDDYFNVNPRPDSYLASHWNVASSQFLIGASDNTVPPPVFRRAAPAMLARQGTGSLTTRWTNDGDYSFTVGPTRASTTISVDRIGERYTAGDVNGDGRDDAVAAYQQSNGALRIYVWPGGTGAAVAWYTSAGAFSLTGAVRLLAGDFNADGRDDVAFLRSGPGGTAQLFRMLSTGTAFAAPTMTWSGSYDLAKLGTRLAVGDVNGDGADDVVGMYAQTPRPFPTTWFHVWLQAASFQGDGAWGSDDFLDMAWVGDRFTVGDFNDDGLADVVAYTLDDTQSQVYWWRSIGTRFQDEVLPAPTPREFFDVARAGARLATGDVTGDGIDDVTMAAQEPDGSYTLHVFRGGWRWMGQAWYRHPTAYNLDTNVGGRLLVGVW